MGGVFRFPGHLLRASVEGRRKAVCSVQNRTDKSIMDVLVRQIHDDIPKAVRCIPQDPVQFGTEKLIVDVPVVQDRTEKQNAKVPVPRSRKDTDKAVRFMDEPVLQAVRFVPHDFVQNRTRKQIEADPMLQLQENSWKS